MKPDHLKVGSLIAERGEKVQGTLGIPDSDLKIPVTLLNGKGTGKTVVILSGIHGGEYPGIETAIRLAAVLRSEELTGRVILVHPVNTAAFFARQQYIHPGDGKNLNRVFPGQANGTASDKIAYAITNELFSQADFVMDLHGGDLHEALTPFVIFSNGGSSEVNQVSDAAAKLMGIRYLIGSNFSRTTFGTAGQMGIPGFLAELGQCGSWSEEEVGAYMKGILNVLKYLRLLPGQVEPMIDEVDYLAEFHTVTAQESGCWYPSVQIGDAVKAGTRIGEMRDFFSNPLATYSADQDGIVLVLVKSLAIHALDPIFAIGSLKN